MIKGAVLQEQFQNVYTLNNRVSKYRRKKMIELKRK